MSNLPLGLQEFQLTSKWKLMEKTHTKKQHYV